MELREVVLRDKPRVMLAASQKGTVPVLILNDGRVIDESRDIMMWALAQHDPDDWLPDVKMRNDADRLIDDNDGRFKSLLDKYKYADRHPEHPQVHYREQSAFFLRLLETRLTKQRCLLSDRISVADIAVFPFIRQYAFVDKNWFDQSPYRRLRTWLDEFLASQLFISVMTKYPPWKAGSEATVFPEKSAR